MKIMRLVRNMNLISTAMRNAGLGRVIVSFVNRLIFVGIFVGSILFFVFYMSVTGQ